MKMMISEEPSLEIRENSDFKKGEPPIVNIQIKNYLLKKTGIEMN